MEENKEEKNIKKEKKIEEKACGCVIIDGDKVLLVKEQKGHWGFPKGHVEGNETELETAKREVKEETNLDVIIDESKRYSFTYYTDKGRYKEQVLFVAKLDSNDIKRQEKEIAEIQWFDFDEALKKLTFRNSAELLEEILNSLR